MFAETMQRQKVMSNLPLQMALYFNVTFFPVWAIVILLFLHKHYGSYGEFYRYISVALILTVLLMEIARLYLGYEGNLKDKIPELAGFWMLSLLIQLPLQGFLLFNPYFGMYVVEKIVQSIMFIMLSFELVAGYCALRHIAKEQAKEFQAKKKEHVEKMS